MIYFVGDSFAPRHLRNAAIRRGLSVAPKLNDEVQLVFVSQDTEVEPEYGNRILQPIKDLISETREKVPDAVMVLTSQVPPGFTRALRMDIYCMAETLRIKDAADRAYKPEQFIIGCKEPFEPLPTVLLNYLNAFKCPIHQVLWEEAEFAKIAINMRLARMVESTNELAEACKRIPGCKWDVVANILRHDGRIGALSYLEPGDWRKSKHLLRDAQSLADLVPETVSRVAGKITIPSFRWGSTRLG